MKRAIVMSVMLLVLIPCIAYSTDWPPKEDPDRKNDGTTSDMEACHANTTTFVLGAAAMVAPPFSHAGWVMGACALYFSLEGMGKCKCMNRPYPLRDSQGNYHYLSVCTVYVEHPCGNFLGYGGNCCWVPGSVGECLGGGAP